MNIPDWLAATGKTHRELSELVGVSEGAVAHWVHGRNPPGPKMALKIEAATDGVVTKEELRPDIFLP